MQVPCGELSEPYDTPNSSRLLVDVPVHILLNGDKKLLQTCCKLKYAHDECISISKYCLIYCSSHPMKLVINFLSYVIVGSTLFALNPSLTVLVRLQLSARLILIHLA